ncbi:MAG: YbdK family carboxylate-amine ligase [Clostridia bacterium]|nr:YbdK family carboxylate-amine ligase [Clostridia bacterium]
MAGMVRAFATARDLTLGVEEEFLVVAPSDGRPIGRAPEVVAAARRAGWGERVQPELKTCQVETVTPPCPDWSALERAIGQVRAGAAALADAVGVSLLPVGVHPLGDDGTSVTPEPYYLRLHEDYRYLVERSTTASLHVHVGVRGADRAVRLADGLRPFLPLLLALSASSPCVAGRPTGLRSNRAVFFLLGFPRAGVPDAFGTWSAYADYLQFLATTASVWDWGQVWWSVRLHHRYGTVEVRVCDAQPDAADAGALAGLTAALAAHILDLVDAGRLSSSPPTRFIAENLWRAMRDGTDARLVDLETRVERPVRDLLAGLLRRLRPSASARGLLPALERVADLAERGDAASRLLRALRCGSALAEVVPTLCLRPGTGSVAVRDESPHEEWG